MTDSEIPTITKGYKELVEEAKADIETLSVDEALEYFNNDVVFVDVRSEGELRDEGKIPDAVHASRGLLEFYVDPDSPIYKEEFADYGKLILYCKEGWRSPLAAQRLQKMGFESVAHLETGFEGWKDADGPVEDITE